MKLFLKGDRCYTDRCAIDRRNYAPGQHGRARSKFSDYGNQLREKQRVKRIYGVLEKQCRRYFEKAARQRGATGENFLMLLERRLDNVVYRLNFAYSRNHVRQMSHTTASDALYDAALAPPDAAVTGGGPARSR